MVLWFLVNSELTLKNAANSILQAVVNIKKHVAC